MILSSGIKRPTDEPNFIHINQGLSKSNHRRSFLGEPSLLAMRMMRLVHITYIAMQSQSTMTKAKKAISKIV